MVSLKPCFVCTSQPSEGIIFLNSGTTDFINNYLTEIKFKFPIEHFYETHIICLTCYEKFCSLHELTTRRNALLLYFIKNFELQDLLNKDIVYETMLIDNHNRSIGNTDNTTVKTKIAQPENDEITLDAKEYAELDDKKIQDIKDLKALVGQNTLNTGLNTIDPMDNQDILETEDLDALDEETPYTEIPEEKNFELLHENAKPTLIQTAKDLK